LVSIVVDITEISAVVAAVAVVVAAVSIVVQNRKAEKTRKTELMMELFGPLRDFEFVRQWVDILQTWE